MLKVGVTGAGGFVGQRFMEYEAQRYQLTPLALRKVKPADMHLQGLDVIVHLAGKAHDMKNKDEQVYFDVNYGLTKELADEAKRAGVKHFIYVSSVKVYGEGADQTLNETSLCHPEDPYGKSKLKAEEYLHSIKSDSFVISIVRPPVVYGPGVKGNIERLLHALQKGTPLPLGNTDNRRSMVFLDNLIGLIHHIIDARMPGIFIAGDKRPLSTDELVKMMNDKLGTKTKLISIPGFMRSMMKALRPGLYKRLFGSFVVDNTNTNRKLNFTPPYSTEYGIEQMTNWYKNRK